MDSNKPKKALRHLFSRTEPEPETETETETVVESAPVVEAVASPRVKELKEEKKASISAGSVLGAPISAASVSDGTKTKTVSPPSHAETSKAQSPVEAPAVKPAVEEPAPVVLGRAESSEIQTPVSEAAEISSVTEVLAASTNPAVLKEEGRSTQGASAGDAPYSFVRIQYNLDLFKAQRGQWKENDYISFINKIDQAQTDAFFLKGRLVAEIKDRFYLDNKKGWAEFCDQTLNMNYTTANQYIRVAQEFDVTSHHRKDFGFEHFKALLPLNKSQRDELLEQMPSNLSVKNLREIVAKKIVPVASNSNDERNSSNARQVVDTLHKLKTQLARLKSHALSQEEKWQLYGAFQNLSEEMNSLSHSFVAPLENKNESSMTN